ncbi:MAG: DUF2784 domain-containing protein [Burkholderiaceae bacterium]
MPYRWLADAVLTLHVGVVLFVVVGLALILAGNRMGWHWVNAWWLRLTHLATIGVVIAESWLGIVCPLTTLEMWLRAKAAAGTYGGSFIEHWLQRLLYYDAPPWVFVLGYSLFGLLVVATWWVYPPQSRRGPRRAAE